MNDIKIAKELLEKENYTLVVVKNGEVIFTSTDKGIKPMYTLVKTMEDDVKDASIADKVIGRGAALLSQYLKIKEVYAQLISKGAIEILEQNDIKYSFLNVCEAIKNRDHSGLCPIENIALDKTDSRIFLEELEKFFKSK